MFEVRTTSLGDLDGCDQFRVRSFLRGNSWQEQFEEWEEEAEATPPEWLVRRSNRWTHDLILTMEGDDWWICECSLVIDDSSHEAWITVYQGVGGDEGIVFKRISDDVGRPKVDAVCECVLNVLESLGDFPLRGSFTITTVRLRMIRRFIELWK